MRRSNRELKKQEILNSALSLFHTKGFSNVVMSDIAKECGIARTTLYDYFPNKTDILIQLIGDVVKAARHTIPTGETTYEKLVSLGADSFNKVQQNRMIYKIFLQEQANFTIEAKQQLAELSNLWTKQMTSLFQEVMEHGEISSELELKDIVFSYQALVNQRSALFLLTDETINPEIEASRLLRILWFGIRKRN